MITETPPPRQAPPHRSPGSDTGTTTGRVIPMMRRRQSTDTAAPRVEDEQLPIITWTIRLDLAAVPVERQHEIIFELSDLPAGTAAQVHVGAQLPEPRALWALAEVVASRRLRIDLEGTPDTLRSWLPDLRRLIRQLLAEAGQR